MSTVLDQLAPNHDRWLRMAVGICSDKDRAEDLVQEMYLRLYDSEKTEIKPGYIYCVLRSIFIDEIRTNKEQAYGSADDMVVNGFNVFVSIAGDFILNSEDLNEIEVKYELIERALDTFTEPEKQILRLSYSEGPNRYSKRTGVNISTVKTLRKKLKIRVCHLQNKRGSGTSLKTLPKNSVSNPAKVVKTVRTF